MGHLQAGHHEVIIHWNHCDYLLRRDLAPIFASRVNHTALFSQLCLNEPAFDFRVTTARGRNTTEVIIITRREVTKRPMGIAVITNTTRKTAIKAVTPRDTSGRNQIIVDETQRNLRNRYLLSFVLVTVWFYPYHYAKDVYNPQNFHLCYL